MWERWVPNDWCFWTVVLEKTLESSLDCKEIKPVNVKGNQPQIVIESTSAEAKTLIIWPPDVKSWLIGKVSDAEREWGQEEKGVTEDEMVGWHHWLSEHEFEQREWRTGNPDMLQSLGSQRAGRDRMTEPENAGSLMLSRGAGTK